MAVRPWAHALAASMLVTAAAGSAVAGVHAAPAPALPLAGPAVLHEPPADAPQLQNRPGSGWRAKPLLVSGAAALVDGEYLYQGYLFDDHGGRGAADPQDPWVSKFAFAAKAGTLTYPTDPAFVGNAADLVELRVRPTDDGTAIRVTLNSLVDPQRTAFTIAIGTSASTVPWPSGAGVSSPAQLFLTVHGSTAHLTQAASGLAVVPAPKVKVDVPRRQYDVRIPTATWDPGSSVVRFAAGVGLWDKDAGDLPRARSGRLGDRSRWCVALSGRALRPGVPLRGADARLEPYGAVCDAGGRRRRRAGGPALLLA
jgi:hypothetical protein